MRWLDVITDAMGMSLRVASPGLMHNTGCLGLVPWDNPEGWYGEGGGRRVQDGAFQTTQGNRLSCRDQEGRRGSEEAVPGPSVFPSEGNGTPLQYFCLENPMDGGAWWAAVYGITQSRTLLK